MTDESYLKLILDGQRDTGKKVDNLATVVAKLEQRVEGWEKQSVKAQDAHEKCRAEVDGAIKQIDSRLAPIERLHDQQAGGAKSMALAWKMLSGALAVAVAVLAILGGTGVLG